MIQSMIFKTILLCLSIALVCGEEATTEPKLQIVNGYPASPQEANFVVALDVEYDNEVNHYQCGGSLIRNKFVLTAAHCVNGSKSIMVTYGTVDIRLPRARRFADIKAKAIVHPDYKKNHNGKFNDIAILILEHDVEVDHYAVGMAMLPPPDHYSYNPYTQVATFGWGSTDNHGSPPDSLMRSRGLVLVDPGRWGYGNDKTLLLAQSPNSGVCDGDSGGPLIIDEDVVIGVVARGWEDCVVGLPTVFTKVEPYLDWIMTTIFNN